MATVVDPNATALRAHTSGEGQHARPINILLTTFAGLGLPRTLSIPTSPSETIGNVVRTIQGRLPPGNESLVITTNGNKQLLLGCGSPVTSLLDDDSSMLPLRLSLRLCGGKGGFGSQLRAAGGRMSSRKNRQNQQAASGSNRNLDGRRLRTVDEAKRLADYLAIKPEMEKREKEERKKRWEAVVEAADRREAEIKSGKAGNNGGRLDADYVESKELAEERTREAVLKAMRDNMMDGGKTGSESSMEEEEDASDAEVDEHSSSSSDGVQRAEGSRSFFGWDEDEDVDEESDESDKSDEIDEVVGDARGGTVTRGADESISQSADAALRQIEERIATVEKGKGRM